MSLTIFPVSAQEIYSIISQGSEQEPKSLKPPVSNEEDDTEHLLNVIETVDEELTPFAQDLFGLITN